MEREQDSEGFRYIIRTFLHWETKSMPYRDGLRVMCVCVCVCVCVCTHVQDERVRYVPSQTAEKSSVRLFPSHPQQLFLSRGLGGCSESIGSWPFLCLRLWLSGNLSAGWLIFSKSLKPISFCVGEIPGAQNQASPHLPSKLGLRPSAQFR